MVALLPLNPEDEIRRLRLQESVDSDSKKKVVLPLRVTKWEPRFQVVASFAQAAECINRPHEDYPHRVLATYEVLQEILESSNRHWPVLPTVSTSLLLAIHKIIFGPRSGPDYERHFAGTFRVVDVVIGQHIPPRFSLIHDLMRDLEQRYATLDSVEKLKKWYYDFETIHPFQDGNGRVGGAILALNSFVLTGEILAPLQ